MTTVSAERSKAEVERGRGCPAIPRSRTDVVGGGMGGAC